MQIDVMGAEHGPVRQAASAARTVEAWKVYGDGDAQVAALRGVTVALGYGELTAVMGPSGSGKSTLMHCLAGLDSVTSGEAYLGDIRLAGLPDRDLTRLRRDQIGFVFQQFNLLPTLSAGENILLPLSIAGRRPDSTWYERVVATLGIADRLGHRPGQLSGGQQQRVACARALICRPRVVFADEPTGNLDSRAGAQTLGLLRDCVREFGQTLVLVTHDPTVASHADRVIVLEDGRIVDDLRDPAPGTPSGRLRGGERVPGGRG